MRSIPNTFKSPKTVKLIEAKVKILFNCNKLMCFISIANTFKSTKTVQVIEGSVKITFKYSITIYFTTIANIINRTKTVQLTEQFAKSCLPEPLRPFQAAQRRKWLKTDIEVIKHFWSEISQCV